MTHRDELNALSNADFGAWIANIMNPKVTNSGYCQFCPADEFCTKESQKEHSYYDTRSCRELIADWLRAEA